MHMAKQARLGRQKGVKNGRTITYLSIRQNYTEIVNGVKKRKRDEIRLGILGENGLTITLAKAAVARFNAENHNIGVMVKPRAFRSVWNEYLPIHDNLLKTGVISKRTWEELRYSERYLKRLHFILINEIDYKHTSLVVHDMVRDGLGYDRIRIVKNEYNRVLKYALRCKYIQSIPEFEIPKNIKNKKNPDPLTVNEIETLLKHPNDNIRYYCRVLITTGMRTFEFANLQPENIDKQAHTISIVNNRKQKKDRTILISTTIREDIYKYIKETGKVCPYVNSHYANKAIGKWAEKHGFKASPKQFRSTFVTLMLEDGASPFKLCEYTGHSLEEMQRAYAKFFPQSFDDMLKNSRLNEL